jgi:long-chain acyl-CoA synthetase
MCYGIAAGNVPVSVDDERSMVNIATIVEGGAREHGEREAIVFEDRRVSYRELDRLAARTAHGLQAAGIGRGDHVALFCPNRLEFVASYYGILKTGATVVSVSGLLKHSEIAYQLADSDAKALIAFGGAGSPMAASAVRALGEVPACRHAWFIADRPGASHDAAGFPSFDDLTAAGGDSFSSQPVAYGDTAVILYTSGTTGAPKGAELTHGNILMNVMALARERPAKEGAKNLIALPLFHVFAQTCLMNHGLFNGSTLVLMQRFDARAAVSLILDEGITGLAGVPTMFRAMLDDSDITDDEIERVGRQLAAAGSGGASLAPELQKEFHERFGVPMVDGYGCTETSPVVCFLHEGATYRPGSCGTPIWGVDVRIVDAEGHAMPAGEVGELTVRGHNVMKGYYKRPEETAKVIRDGWYHTGDLARIDADGYIYIVGRLKEMIIRGGFNVYPAEVESHLLRHPDIAMAAVVGVPHATHGEEIKAVVVAKPGAALEAEDIRAWAREDMAAHKYPRLVEIRDSLPLGPTGKVLKRELV